MKLLPAVLAERNFRFLFVARATSAFGDRLAPVALPFAVLSLGGSTKELGLVEAAAVLPTLLLITLGGTLADRVRPQRIMLLSDVINTCVQSLTALLLITGTANLWHLALLQAIWGASSAFLNPAFTSVVPLVVRSDDLQEANAALGLPRSIASIGGPAAAGFLVVTVGPGWAFAFDALTFAISAVAMAPLWNVGTRTMELPGLLVDLREGWHEFTSRRWLWTVVLYFGFFHVFYIAPIHVIGPAVAEAALGGAKAWGTILAVGGVGGVIGGVLAMRWKPRRAMVVFVSLSFVFAPELVMLAIPAPVPVIALAAFVGGVGMSYGLALWLTMLQRHIPQRSLARVSAYDWLGSLLFYPLGAAVVGFLGEAIGFGPTLWLGFAGVIISTLMILSLDDVRAIGIAPDEELQPATA
jgi:predicted MFS family arabinose efflux permease